MHSEVVINMGTGEVSTRLLSGHRLATVVLKCGHKIPTQLTMRMLRVKKGETRECPQECGMQGVKQVESRPNPEV
jgi:hypothetical protein